MTRMSQLPCPGFTRPEIDELLKVLDDIHNSAIAAGMDCDVDGPDYQRWEDEVVGRLIDTYRGGG